MDFCGVVTIDVGVEGEIDFKSLDAREHNIQEYERSARLSEYSRLNNWNMFHFFQ